MSILDKHPKTVLALGILSWVIIAVLLVQLTYTDIAHSQEQRKMRKEQEIQELKENPLMKQIIEEDSKRMKEPQQKIELNKALQDAEKALGLVTAKKAV